MPRRSRHNTPVEKCLAEGGEGWEFVAMMGTDKAHHHSVYKVYLTDGRSWWEFDYESPTMLEKSPAPSRYYSEPMLVITGPVNKFPLWLVWDENREGLTYVCTTLKAHTSRYADLHAA